MRAESRGALTLAITNEPNSPLTQSADYVIDIQAGAEKAVAATKTYTTELMSIAMLSAALSGNKKHWEDLGKVPGWMKEALKQDDVHCTGRAEIPIYGSNHCAWPWI